MPQLTEWLKLMNAEIARKREDAERAREEELRRQSEQAQANESLPVRGSASTGVAAAKRRAR